MGTGGWFALLHKGRYYRVRRYYDSYFSGLGTSIEKKLKQASHDLAALLRLWGSLLDLGTVENDILTPPTGESG